MQDGAKAGTYATLPSYPYHLSRVQPACVTILLPHPRACYALSIMKVMNRLSISIAKARKCKPAKVSGNRS